MNLDTISKKQLLRDSPFYFIQKIFGFRVDGVHEKIINHLLLPENNLTLISRGHGKSKMAQGMIAWWICNNPDERILLVSDTDRKATLFLNTIKQVIESSPVIKKFYGDLRGETWTDHAITIKGRSKIQTEPTLMCIGAGSGAATGLHATKIVVDDLVSFDSARSELQRTRTADWYRTTLLPVLVSSGKFCVLGTRYHTRDIYDDLINSLHYNTLLLPAINDKNESLCEWLVPMKDRCDDEGNLLQVGLETIRESLGLLIWELQYQNSTKLLNQHHIIKYDYIQYYDSFYFNEDGKLFVNNNGENILINRVNLGVDPAISEKESADFSGLVAIGRGTDDNFYVLDSIAKHLTLNGQIEEIQKVVEKWSVSKTLIEDVAYQKALIQELQRRSGLRIKAIKPTRDKSSRLSMVSGRFETKKVFFLKNQKSIINQLLDFPDGLHDDLVDACVYSLFGFRSSKGGMVVLRL